MTKAPLSFFLAGFLAIGIFSTPTSAEEKVNKFGFMLPKIDLRYLLETTGRLANKKVIVATEEDLKHETALILPGPVSDETTIKAVSALLLLEGYELAETGEELHLRRILTPEQVSHLRKGAGLPESVKLDSLPRVRLPKGAKAPESWVVIRPTIANEGKEAPAGK